MTIASEVGQPEKHGTGWLVPSGKVTYFVEKLPGRWRCTCPSAARYRPHLRCKHMEACIAMLRSGGAHGLNA
jgi:hypothetical protein